jgi:hypothetical protein
VKNRAVWSLAGVGVLTLAFAAWWWRGSVDLPAPPPSPPSQQGVAPEALSTRRAVQPSLATGEEALPELDAPLATTLPELQRLAGSGHPRAACRLAAEIERCATVSALRQEHDRWLAERGRALELARRVDDPGAAQRFDAEFQAQLARREEVLRGISAHCATVDVAAPLDRIARWRAAARLGDPTAIRQYASGRVFSWGDIVATSAALPDYRREAEPMLLSLAAAGDLEATLLLAAAYSSLPSSSRSLLGQAVTPDGARSLALYRRALAAVREVDSHAARTLASDIGQQLDQLENNLPPEALQRAGEWQAETGAQWAAADPVDVGRRPITALGTPRPAPPAACE